jgi:hypothetical protein
MTITVRNSQLDEKDINSLETRLGNLLSLRQANPEFVQTLKTRLTYKPRITLEVRKKYKALWFCAVALFSGGLLVFVLSLLSDKSGKPTA